MENLSKKTTLDEYIEKFDSEIHAHIYMDVDRLIWLPDVFQKYPETNRIFNFYALGTDPSYRGRGIATQLVKQAFEVRKINDGCKEFQVYGLNLGCQSSGLPENLRSWVQSDHRQSLQKIRAGTNCGMQSFWLLWPISTSFTQSSYNQNLIHRMSKHFQFLSHKFLC